MPDDPALRIFPDEFLPNIQGAPYHAKWAAANAGGDAPKWRVFRDALLAGQTPVVPSMTTKYGRALVAAGKEHMSISHFVGVMENPHPPPDPPIPVGGGGGGVPAQFPPTPTFSKFAAPAASGGSDSNPGTQAQPYLTLVKLQTSLLPGQAGALRAGTYGTSATYHNLSASGTSGNQIVVQNYPGERVTVKGYLDLRGSYTTIRNLHIDGSNTALVPTDKCGAQTLGITAPGTNNIFEWCEIYHSTAPRGSAFVVSGNNLIIRYCTMHDLGFCHAFDHGIYIGDGNDSQAYGNWMWNNSNGWALHFYSAPNRARFYANVADAMGVGVVFGDDGALTCTDNWAYNNVFINMVGMTTQSGFVFQGAGIGGAAPVAGSNNVFRDNCVFNCPGGVGTQANVTITGNITSNPLFVDPPNRDYRLQAGSPCAAYGLPDFIVGPTV